MAKRKIRSEKTDLVARARRAAGQARAVTEMLETDAYCVDVLTQIAAARAALTSLGRLVLGEHMRTCVAEAFTGGKANRAIDELDSVLSKFLK